MTKKTCWRCNEAKELNEYYNERRAADGKQDMCKKCNKSYKLEHLKLNKVKIQAKRRQQYLKKEKPFLAERYAASKDETKIRNQLSTKTYRRTIIGKTNSLLIGAKRRAKDKNREYTISKEWMNQTWMEQNGCCLLTGIKFSLDSCDGTGHHFNPYTPSLDRINPSGGYTPDNTRLICTGLNLALNSFGDDTYAHIATEYLKRNKGATEAPLIVQTI